MVEEATGQVTMKIPEKAFKRKRKKLEEEPPLVVLEDGEAPVKKKVSELSCEAEKNCVTWYYFRPKSGRTRLVCCCYQLEGLRTGIFNIHS